MRPPSLEHSIWIKGLDLAFVYIPKVACTSWKIYFSRALGLETPKGYADIHSGQQLPLPYVSGMDSDQQQIFINKIRAGCIEVVSILREPRERILSAYIDKIYNHSNPNSYFSLEVIPSVKKYAKLQGRKELSLELFLGWLAESNSPHSKNDHWLPMSCLLGLAEDGKPSDSWKFWTMLQMHQAHQYLNQRLGVSILLPTSQELGSRKSTESHSKVDSAFSADAQRQFETLYQQDILLYDNVQ